MSSDFDPEAMAEVIEELLYDMSPNKRVAVLEIALAAAKAQEAEIGILRVYDASDDFYSSSAMRHYHEIKELKARAIYRFTRNIVNNMSPQSAAGLLLRQHRGMPGSGWLDEYLEIIGMRQQRRTAAGGDPPEAA
jgi:hypothetical protein